MGSANVLLYTGTILTLLGLFFLALKFYKDTQIRKNANRLKVARQEMYLHEIKKLTAQLFNRASID